MMAGDGASAVAKCRYVKACALGSDGPTNGLMHCTKIGAVLNLLVRHAAHRTKSLSLLQVERVEASGEPAADRSEKIAGLVPRLDKFYAL
jgi:hypothetical protein